MQVLKYGVTRSVISLSFPFTKDLSISNFRQRATKIPGTTMSPSPSMLNFYYPASFMYGNMNLIGMSRFLATVTMTSVP